MRSTTATYLQSFTAMYTLSGSQHCSTKKRNWWMEMEELAKPTLYEMWEHWLSRVRRRSPQSRWVYVRSRNVAPLIRGRMNRWTYHVHHDPDTILTWNVALQYAGPKLETQAGGKDPSRHMGAMAMLMTTFAMPP
jgi:hypothetical protein